MDAQGALRADPGWYGEFALRHTNTVLRSDGDLPKELAHLHASHLLQGWAADLGGRIDADLRTTYASLALA
jgi:hypothetical protein